MGSFALHDDQAQEWLTELIIVRELSGAFDVLAPSVHALPIGMAWQHGIVGEEDTAALLVRAAQQRGVITGPPGTQLEVEYVDDGDEGYYCYLLDVASPAPLTLASPPQEVRRLADPAVAAGQQFLGQLSRAIAGGTAPDEGSG